MTATVINWINGGNGTGQPSYIRNLSGHMQNVGDIQADAFFRQFTANSNSPFATAIRSSLSIRYLQNTSSAGFFAANRSTLNQASPNVGAYLSGNWSQGGVRAWFALTTQPQNNPYMLYQASQRQLGSLISDAQTARANELAWGQGFLSWCGPQDVGGTGTPGTAPGDTCKKKDGSAGQIQTPGSIIHHYTEKAVVDSGFDQYINANDLDVALDAIIGALIGQVLGGVNGLFGASQSSGGGGRSLVGQLQAYTPVTNAPVDTTSGLLQSAISQGAAQADSQSGSPIASTFPQTMLNRLTQYESSWGVIRSVTDFTSSALADLANSCPAQSGAVQNAITSQITPILTQANTADAVAAAAQAMVQQVQNEFNSGVTAAYTADLQTLGSMAPSDFDVTSAEQATQSTGGAIATPAGSLNVTGGTIIDRLALISTNTAALQAACP